MCTMVINSMAQNHLELICSLTERPNMLPTTGSWVPLTACARAVSSSSSLILYATREKAELMRLLDRCSCSSGTEDAETREKAEFIISDDRRLKGEVNNGRGVCGDGARIVDGVSGPLGTTVASASSDKRSYSSRGAYVSCCTMRLMSAPFLAPSLQDGDNGIAAKKRLPAG